MQKNSENNEIIIDFNKILEIIWYRKLCVITCFAVVITVAVFLTFVSPKKYETEARILINKSNSTNMAEINPFVLADGSNGGVSSLFSSGSNLSDELEIIQSPLVLDAVIKVNNLRYSKGLKKGKYLNVDDFLKNNIVISNTKGTSVISIKYKSTDPKEAYNVVTSIVNNYKDIYENINNKKATSDKSLIYKSYVAAKSELESKVERLKQMKASVSSASSDSGAISFSLLGFYDNRINQKLNKMSVDNVEVQSLERQIDQDSEKVKMLSSKLEWSSLVENLSKEASKVVVLKEPEIRNSFDFSDPSLVINLVLSVAFSVFISTLVLILFEMTDKKLTYSDVDEKSFLVKNKKEFNTVGLVKVQTRMISAGIKDLLIVSFTNKDFTENFVKAFKENQTFSDLKLSVSNGSFKEQVSNLNNFNDILILSKIGYTDKNFYREFKDIANELNKNILADCVVK